MLKVLMFGWEFPPQISGGLGVACHGIVNGLAQNDIDVSLVLPCVESRSSDPKHIHMFDCRHSVHVFSQYSIQQLGRRINVQTTGSLLNPYQTQPYYRDVLMQHGLAEGLLNNLEAPHYDFHGDYGLNLLNEVMCYALVAAQYAHEVEHDVIHAHEWLTILAGIEARKISGKALIYHVHALETDRNPQGMNQVVFDLEQYGMQQADQVIAVSEYTKRCIVEHYGIAADKITVSYNGILPAQLNDGVSKHNAKPSRNAILFLGRTTQQKGPFYFIEAAHKVLAQRQDVDFIVAGDGDLWQSMIHEVARLRIGSYVHFTKFLSKSLTQEIFTRSKLLVMSSISEPFGLVCLEAIAQQLPVIISKQSGVSEVIDDCFKVDFWDTDKLAEYIITVLDDDGLADRMTANAYQQLTQLVWVNQVKPMIELYQQLS